MGILPNPWFILGLVLLFLSCGGFGYFKGYQAADRTAEIHGLNDKLAQANATVAAKDAEAKANAAVTSAFAQRAIGDAQTFQSQIQEPVDEIVTHEEAKPPSDVCRLDGTALDLLRNLARPAGPSQANPPGSP